MSAFHNDAGFVAALDKACGKFINSNAVTKTANSSSKSPELLAKYCDLLLKKSAKNPEEAELEDTLNQVVMALLYTFKISTTIDKNFLLNRWWSLNTLKIRMYFRLSIAKCWLNAWFTTCQLPMMQRHQ
jgi:hypothetical protein